MRKSLSGIFEYWKSFRFINLILCVCGIVGKSHEEGAEALWIKTECFVFFCMEAMRTVLQAD